MAKPLPHDIQVSSPSVPTFQPRQSSLSQQVEDSTDSDPLSQIKRTPLPQASNSGTPSKIGSSTHDHFDALAAETLGASSTSSLLAAVMKSGILSNSSVTTSSLPNLNFRDLGQLTSQTGQPSLPTGPILTQVVNSGSRAAPTSSLAHSSYDGSSASSRIPRKKVEQPPLPPGPPPSLSPLGGASENDSNVVKKVPDPISNLLSSLVAKGLISASKSESPTVIPPQVPTQIQKSPSVTSTGSVPLTSVSASTASSNRDDTSFSEPDTNSPVAHPQSMKSEIPQSTNLEIKNLIGFEFKPDKIRKFHSSVVSELLDGFEHRCTICGLQLKLQEQLNRHLEWHDLKNPEANGSTNASRKWYANSRDWVNGVAGLPSGFDPAKSVDKPGKTVDKGEPMVPADESQCVCVLCGEIFEDFYCEEKDEWMFKGAIHMITGEGTNNESTHKGPIVHANCISGSSLPDLGLVSSIKTVACSYFCYFVPPLKINDMLIRRALLALLVFHRKRMVNALSWSREPSYC